MIFSHLIKIFISLKFKSILNFFQKPFFEKGFWKKVFQSLVKNKAPINDPNIVPHITCIKL